MDLRPSKSLCTMPGRHSTAEDGPAGALQFCRFMQAARVAWDHLNGSSRKAIRAASRSGRLLYDSTTTHLEAHLATESRPSNSIWPSWGWSAERMEVQALLWGLLTRGAKLASMTIDLHGSLEHKPRAPPLDALASAASIFRLSSVTLKAHVLALMRCSNESLAAVSHVPTRMVIDAPRGGDWTLTTTLRGLSFTDHYLAVGHALCQTWSRLRELDINMGDWPAGLELPQHYFPSLASLKVKLRGDGYNVIAPTPEGEAELMKQLTSLPHLRSFSLTVHAVNGWNPDLAPRLLSCSTCLESLGALTALTQLELQLHPVSQPWGDSYEARDTAPLLPIYDDEEALDDAVLAALDQRKASLLHALLCMPSLQHLSCTSLWLTPAEVAQLTALTYLELEGLLPPTAAEAAALLPTNSSPPVWDLPPHLQELRLIGLSASVRALAAIRPPGSEEQQGQGKQQQQRPRCRLHCLCLHFGTGDVAESDGRLLPGAAAAVGRAVEALRAMRPRPGEWTLQVVPDGSEWPMGPPGGEGQQRRHEEGQEQGEGQGEEQQGHAGWLWQLSAAGDECTGLVLQDLTMRAGDLEALAQALPQLKRLVFCGTALPLCDLPRLATLRQLRELELDMTQVESEEFTEVAEVEGQGEKGAEQDPDPAAWAAWGGALAALCSEATALRAVTVLGMGFRADVGEVRGLVERRMGDAGREPGAVALDLS